MRRRIDTDKLRGLLWSLHVSGSLTFEEFCELQKVLALWKAVEVERTRLRVKKALGEMTEKAKVEMELCQRLLRAETSR